MKENKKTIHIAHANREVFSEEDIKAQFVRYFGR